MSETVRVSRDDMIDHLTQSMLDDLEMNPEGLERVCRRGFMGYEEYSTPDLIYEYKAYICADNPNSVDVVLTEGI